MLLDALKISDDLNSSIREWQKAMGNKTEFITDEKSNHEDDEVFSKKTGGKVYRYIHLRIKETDLKPFLSKNINYERQQQR